MLRMLAMVVLGCAGEKPEPTVPVDPDTDTDTDADADADTDADTDSDADTDPPTEGPSSCADAGASLDFQEYVTLVTAEVCFWWDACDTEGTCGESGSATTPSTCLTFDAEAACACLDGAWGCDPSTGMPHAPPACYRVCPDEPGPGTDTDPTTDPPTPGGSGAPTGDDDDDTSTTVGGSGP